MRSLKNVGLRFLGIWRALVSLLVMKPLLFLNRAFLAKNLQGLKGQLTDPGQTDEIKALSAAFGVFMGITPFWGFQTVIAIFFAFVFRLNKALVVICSQVSFPPFMPLIIFVSYRAGAYLCHGDTKAVAKALPNKNLIGEHLLQYICGSFACAIAGGLMAGLLTLGWLKSVKLLKQYRLAKV